jgi:hypothetical protein
MPNPTTARRATLLADIAAAPIETLILFVPRRFDDEKKLTAQEWARRRRTYQADDDALTAIREALPTEGWDYSPAEWRRAIAAAKKQLAQLVPSEHVFVEADTYDEGYTYEVDPARAPRTARVFTFSYAGWEHGDIVVTETSGTIRIKIGCQDYTLAQWRRHGLAVIRRHTGNVTSEPRFPNRLLLPLRSDFPNPAAYEVEVVRQLREAEAVYAATCAARATSLDSPQVTETWADLQAALDAIETKLAATPPTRAAKQGATRRATRGAKAGRARRARR